jgi:hypothetical protein
LKVNIIFVADTGSTINVEFQNSFDNTSSMSVLKLLELSRVFEGIQDQLPTYGAIPFDIIVFITDIWFVLIIWFDTEGGLGLASNVGYIVVVVDEVVDVVEVGFTIIAKGIELTVAFPTESDTLTL